MLEPISSRSTIKSPVSFLYDGDPATFDDEIRGLFRFGMAVLFEIEWLVLLLMLTSLFPSLALKTFSAPCKKTLWVLSQPDLVHLLTSRHSGTCGQVASKQNTTYFTLITELVELGSFP